MGKIRWLITNFFTGDNNKDLSFVRVTLTLFGGLIFFMVAIGVPLWTLIAIMQGYKGLPTLADWGTYYAGASPLIAATFAGIAGTLWANERPKPGAPDNQPTE